jgi:hypothetical protein
LVRTLATLVMFMLASGVTVEGTRVRALSAFRKGDFARACQLYAQVARARPASSEAWNDLSLCQFRRGDIDAGRAAAARAILTGTQTDRLHAYFNLARFARSEMDASLRQWSEVQEEGELPIKVSCFEVPPVPGCSSPLWQCDWVRLNPFANHSDLHHGEARFGRSEQEARDSVAPPIVFSDVDEFFESPGLWNEVECPASGSAHECTIVWVDACARRVGLVCTDETVLCSGERTKPRTIADEASFDLPEPRDGGVNAPATAADGGP